MTRLGYKHLVAICIALLPLSACSHETHPPLFKRLTPGRTGVTFANTITTTDSENVQTDVYVYNGAGVAVGDIDISVSGPEWSKGTDRANLLFINNGDHTFTEAAARYGIADTGFTTHAVFLDYNGDGYLDLFLLNDSPKDFVRTGHPAGIRSTSLGGSNRLYRNNGDGTFADVSREAGILKDVGYGLGVAVADLNGDGRPDIYVSNDVEPNDVLYVNNGDGTFTNKAAAWLKHASFAGMGVDIADFNNDGRPDIAQVDMEPRDLSRRKRMSGFMTHGTVQDLRSRGFREDYGANVLQLNNGITRDGDV